MYFITGANGLIGCYLISHLLNSSSVELKCLVRKQSAIAQTIADVHKIMGQDLTEIQESRLKFVIGDLYDVPLLKKQMNSETIVLHAAACVSFNPKDRQLLFDTNVSGTANMVNVALHKKVKAFAYISSVAAIGRMNANEPITEATEWQDSKNNTAYAISKFHAELEVWRGMEEGLNIVIVNPTVVLGYTSSGNSSSSIFHNIKKGFPFTSLGCNGFVGAMDVAKCLDLLVQKECYGERFVLVSECISYQSLFNSIAAQLGKKPPSIIVKPWMKFIALPIAWLLSKLTRKAPFVTKEVFNTSQKQLIYSAEKVQSTVSFQFTPVHQVVDEVAGLMS